MPARVTFKGSVVTLVGRRLSIGAPAPDFRAVSADLQEKRRSDFAGKVKVINFFPSLDTPVCDLQVREFNTRAAGLSADIVLIGISKDLPFAQKRFCDAHDITQEVLLSDYRTSSFGINYGVLIKEFNLLARGVVIIDRQDLVRYLQVAPEITRGIDFDRALSEAQEAAGHPFTQHDTPAPSSCTPCEGVAATLPRDAIARFLAVRQGWSAVDEKKLVKEFAFTGFAEAKYFLDLIAVIADEQGHHPTMTLSYSKVKITLTTHAAGGVTENDLFMARTIDEIGNMS